MKTKLIISVVIAAIIWFYMFSPWTAGLTNFWLNMSCAAIVLLSLSYFFYFRRTCVWSNDGNKAYSIVAYFLGGILIAAILWGVFWIGDKLSTLMFDFARPQVDDVYSLKRGSSPFVIALLLLLIVGPAEELFWRGYVQRTLCCIFLSKKYSQDLAFLITTLIYTLVHIWSFNFMLIMAAFVAGSIWGLLYRFKPSWLPALVVSHAVWDALVFVILPI